MSLQDNDSELCFCKREQTYKPCVEFQKRISRQGGYYNNCRQCDFDAKSEGASKRDDNTVIETKELLKCIGYNPDSGISIHQQFLKKHFNDGI
jgi:hypothetical protein